MNSYTKIKKELSNFSNCQLCAVSKLQSEEKIKELYEMGQKVFGENYVQELLLKMESLKNLDIKWHFVGSLQSNKVKYIIGKVELIHSVDSLKLVQEIQKQAKKLNIIQKILIQINLSKEESKGGFDQKTLTEYWYKIENFENIEVLGFMTMPPLQNNPEENRIYFKELQKILKFYSKSERFKNIKELSMGTSSDYIVAAEEGATFVRLGTVLFGERNKAK